MECSEAHGPYNAQAIVYSSTDHSLFEPLGLASKVLLMELAAGDIEVTT